MIKVDMKVLRIHSILNVGLIYFIYVSITSSAASKSAISKYLSKLGVRIIPNLSIQFYTSNSPTRQKTIWDENRFAKKRSFGEQVL